MNNSLHAEHNKNIKIYHKPSGHVVTPTNEIKRDESLSEVSTDQMAFKSVSDLHRGHELYARDRARRVVRLLEAMREAGHSTRAMAMLKNRAWIEGKMKAYGVAKDHLELAVDLVLEFYLADFPFALRQKMLAKSKGV